MQSTVRQVDAGSFARDEVIDVSSYQAPASIDWARVQAAGVNRPFVSLRSSSFRFEALSCASKWQAPEISLK